MYKQEQPPKDVWLKSGSKPLLTLSDENGGVFHIIKDDHCLVLFRQTTWEAVNDMLGKRIVVDGKYATHWFPEAVEALKMLPTPQYP